VVWALQVSVRFFTTLREITSKREEQLKFRDSEAVTIKAVLDILSKRYGKSFVGYVFDCKTGEVKGFLQFLVNGRGTAASNVLSMRLSDGDVLAIIPPVGGG
jgi:MoaD family protein